MDTVKLENKGNTLMIAHRGLSGIETENTLQAFVAACNRSYYGVETDVHVTADGRYVIFHDDNTGRLCEEDYVIENTNFETLRGLKFKDGISKMPTLEEYLAVLARYQRVAVIELKNAMPENNIKEIVDICKKCYSLDKIIFISFVFGNLVTLRRFAPQQKIQYLTDKCDGALIEKLKDYNFGIDIGFWALNESNIMQLHDGGVEINCWTCDKKEDADRLINSGVDFITTNILE